MAHRVDQTTVARGVLTDHALADLTQAEGLDGGAKRRKENEKEKQTSYRRFYGYDARGYKRSSSARNGENDQR